MKCIYIRTNLVNGKQYVGQTINWEEREYGWRTRQKYSGGAIDNARKKYGLENFKTEILKECSTQDELNYWEQYYIKELSTKVPNGYNITDGGGGMSGFKHREEDKIKISNALKGEGNPFFGKHHTDEFKKWLSQSRSGENNPNYGKPLSKEQRDKLSNAMKGRHIPHPKSRKKVYQYTLDGKIVKVWDSLKECCQSEGIKSTGISQCFSGVLKTYKGYKWSKQPL
jgi:group I intron endonuclease